MACGWYAVSLLEVRWCMEHENKVQTSSESSKLHENLSPFDNTFESVHNQKILVDSSNFTHNVRRDVVIATDSGGKKLFQKNCFWVLRYA